MAEKIYYSMGEVAEMLDVSTSLVRFWEGKFDILKPAKNKKGNRLFSAQDVRNLKTIYHLVKERGMTLAGADKYLKANRKAIERDMEIAERLASIRALLVEIRHELGGEGDVVESVGEEMVEAAEFESAPVAVFEVETETEPDIEIEPETEPEIEEATGEDPWDAHAREAEEEREELMRQAEAAAQEEDARSEEEAREEAAREEPVRAAMIVEQTLF